MNKLCIAAIIVCWATAAHAETPGASPLYFLNALPAVPTDGCPAKPEPREQFQTKMSKVAAELTDEIGKRRRALKQFQETNSRKMMENAVDMPGFQGKSQAEMKKMSKAEKRKMAEQMMAEKYGVSMDDDLKKQKQANDSGNVMANVAFAKSMAGEKQVDDLTKSKGEIKADERKVKDAGMLAKEQAELSKQLYTSIEGTFATKLEDVAQDKGGKVLKENIYREEKRMAEMLGEKWSRPKDDGYKHGVKDDVMDSESQSEVDGTQTQEEMDRNQRELEKSAGQKASCESLYQQSKKIYAAKEAYCAHMGPRQLEVIKEYQAAVQDAQSRYLQLDQISSDLQKNQVGMELPDAARGLSGLEAVQKYADALGKTYTYDLTGNVHPEMACDENN